MAHRNDHHRRREASTRTHVAAKIEPRRASVLLSTENLVHAHRRASLGGKKNLEGLYLPSGDRVEPLAEHVQDEKVGGEEAKKEQALAKVAATHKSQTTSRVRKCEQDKKTMDELDDEEAAKKAAHVRTKVTEHEMIQFNQLFDFFDVDKDRTWGSIEFAQRMTDVGCNTSVESASNLLYFAGVRDVDRITYDDFLLMMPKLRAFRTILERDAMRAFGERDLNCTGFLSRKALKEVILELAGPEGMDHHQVNQLVRKADRERTGRITFPFFVQALFGTPPLLEYKPAHKKKGWLATFFGCGSSTGHHHHEEEEEDEDTKV